MSDINRKIVGSDNDTYQDNQCLRQKFEKKLRLCIQMDPLCQQGNVACKFNFFSTFQKIGEANDQIFEIPRKCYNRFTDNITQNFLL